MPSRELVVWRPPAERPEVIEQRAAEKKRSEAVTAETAARLAQAKLREQTAEMLSVGATLVVSQLRKYLRISESPDFENSVGPIEPAIILKLAEFVNKNNRLDSGQATENIAHAVQVTFRV
jgi:hypothetical protein